MLLSWSIHQSAAMLCHLPRVCSSAWEMKRFLASSLIRRFPRTSNCRMGTSRGTSDLCTIPRMRQRLPTRSRSSILSDSTTSAEHLLRLLMKYRSSTSMPDSFSIPSIPLNSFLPFPVRKYTLRLTGELEFLILDMPCVTSPLDSMRLRRTDA